MDHESGLNKHRLCTKWELVAYVSMFLIGLAFFWFKAENGQKFMSFLIAFVPLWVAFTICLIVSRRAIVGLEEQIKKAWRRFMGKDTLCLLITPILVIAVVLAPVNVQAVQVKKTVWPEMVTKVKVFGEKTKSAVKEKPIIELLSRASDSVYTNSSTKIVGYKMTANGIDGSKRLELELKDAEVGSDEAGNLYLIVGADTYLLKTSGSGIILRTQDGDDYNYPESPAVVCAVIIGGIIVIWIGYKIGQCISKLISNYDQKLSNAAGDSLAFLPPPTIPGDNLNGGNPPASLLSLPDMTIKMRQTDGFMYSAPVTGSGWVDSFGNPMVTAYISSVVATNLEAVPDAGGVATPCWMQTSSNTIDWSDITNGTLQTIRSWESDHELIMVIEMFGERCQTNSYYRTTNSGVGVYTPRYAVGKLPCDPKTTAKFFRLRAVE